MDEKVLDLFIERLETSVRNYELHKNAAWRECLESDRSTLKNYCMKNSGKAIWDAIDQLDEI